MLAGFHSAGLLLHDLPTAIEALAKIGFQAIAVRTHRNLLCRGAESVLREIKDLADQRSFAILWDAEGSFVTDPWTQAPPGLTSDHPQAREKLILQSMDLAAAAGSRLVTFGAGPDNGSLTSEQALDRLAGQYVRLIKHAQQVGVQLAVRPSAGSSLATIGQFERFRQWLAADVPLLLAGDTAAMLQQGELPTIDFLRRQLENLVCVYAADRAMGAREDAPLGTGDVDLPRLVAGLRDLPYAGPVILRSGDPAHAGLAVAKKAYADLFST